MTDQQIKEAIMDGSLSEKVKSNERVWGSICISIILLFTVLIIRQKNEIDSLKKCIKNGPNECVSKK